MATNEKNHHPGTPHSHSSPQGTCKHKHGNHHHNGHPHHAHHHAEAYSSLSVAFFLNLVFAIIEFFGGMVTNSIAVISDAVHDFGDAMAIGMAWLLERYSKKEANKRFSYGYRRLSTLGGLLIGTILLFSSAIIVIRAIPRLIHPEETQSEGMFALALLGLAVNGYAAFRVSRGTSINERMVMWHLLEDAFGWILVLISSIVIYFWHWYQLDAALAILLAFWIAYNVFNNLRSTLQVFLQAVPAHLELEKIESELRKIPLIKDIHHTHLWSLDGEKHIFTAHVVVDDKTSLEEIEATKKDLKKTLTHWSIYESNIEFESPNAECAEPNHE